MRNIKTKDMGNGITVQMPARAPAGVRSCARTWIVRRGSIKVLVRGYAGNFTAHEAVDGVEVRGHRKIATVAPGEKLAEFAELSKALTFAAEEITRKASA